MQAWILAAALSFVPTPQGDAPLDRRVLDAAVAELDTAFQSGTGDDRVRAIQRGIDVLDARVVDGIERGLRDGDERVRLAAAEGLGRMAHPRALEVLHAFARRSKAALEKDERLFPVVLRAVGRHASASSIELLASDPFTQRTHAAIQARIYGLGNIRSEKAVEALLDLMKKVGPNQLDRYMDDIRLALVHLTGEDQGKAPEMWFTWWRAQDRYKVPAVAPGMRDIDQLAWDSYWDPDAARTRRAGGKRDKR